MLINLDINRIIERKKFLFEEELQQHEIHITYATQNSSFLVIGAAGSVGHQVVKEIVKRSPRKLHAVDLNENNLAELVRDLRSSELRISGDFRTFVLDAGSTEFEEYFRNEGPFDFILNLSALKHVRSEKDPYTLMRMLRINVLNVDKILKMASTSKSKKVFSVSTDKAVNPVNIMGATKRIMEILLATHCETVVVSSSRFVNVAFSEGSLLWSFLRRLEKGQPLAAPTNIKRYFMTPQESGVFCLLSSILAENAELFFPKIENTLVPLDMVEIATRVLNAVGFKPFFTYDENEAKESLQTLLKERKWPVYLTSPDTTGEKELEHLYSPSEPVDLTRYVNIGVLNLRPLKAQKQAIDTFIQMVTNLLEGKSWTRGEIVSLIKDLVPEFSHLDTGKFLDEKM